jgi:hypothetical protein
VILGQRRLHPPQRRDAVDERVMDLVVHREPATAHPVDHVQLPQRTPPVQVGAVQLGGQLEQFADPARRGQPVVPHVVLGIDRVVLFPRPVAEIAEPVPDPPAEHRVHPRAFDHLAVQVGDVLRPRVVGELEQHQPADMGWVGRGSRRS